MVSSMVEDKENNTDIHCPRCGKELRRIGRVAVARITGITE